MSAINDKQMQEINRHIRSAFFTGILVGISLGIVAGIIIDAMTK